MKTIGIRELRQRASQVLRMVEHGESFEVTDCGRAVARLIPRKALETLATLREQGDITSHTKSFDDLPLPLLSPAGRKAPSETLARLRRHER